MALILRGNKRPTQTLTWSWPPIELFTHGKVFHVIIFPIQCSVKCLLFVKLLSRKSLWSRGEDRGGDGVWWSPVGGLTSDSADHLGSFKPNDKDRRCRYAGCVCYDVTRTKWAHFVYLCEAGIPKAWRAETSAGARAWTDSEGEFKEKCSGNGSCCTSQTDWCWGYLREVRVRWLVSARTAPTCIFPLRFLSMVRRHCLQLRAKDCKLTVSLWKLLFT